MNYKTSFKLSSVVLAAAMGVGASGAVLDTFLTFSGGGVNPGILLTRTGIGNATPSEAPETLPLTDTDFSNLTRRATLTVAVGTAQSSLNNNAIPGKLSWGNNPGNAGNSTIRYDFLAAGYPTGIDLGSLGYNQLDVDFSSADLLGSIDVQITPNSGSPITVSSAVNNLTSVVSFPSSSFVGIWDQVRTIRFTLSSPNSDGADYVIQEIRLTNNQVPEAKTLVPALGFAAGIGFLAWRRRSAK